MKIQICSVGKTHETYIEEGIAIFCNRINHYFPISWQILSPPKQAANMDATVLKEEEGKKILEFLQPTDKLILLDERGKNLHSPELANLLQQHADQGTKNLVFLIGGAYGVSDAVKKRADFCWSLSNLVFPHMLVRLILAEQLYRACTIMRNEKYHHA
jgi:23S rRNA (pseudouridine1915-N3)-methyltransferase